MVLILIGLLDKTTSVLGKHTLKEWVSRPMTDKQTLENRHLAIGLFMASDMRDTSVALRSHLRHIKNIHRLLAKVRESKAKTSDWQYILKVNLHVHDTHTLIIIPRNSLHTTPLAF